MVFRDSRLDEMADEQVEHQIGFSAAPYARDNLDHPVALADDEVVQILVTPNLYAASSPLHAR